MQPVVHHGHGRVTRGEFRDDCGLAIIHGETVEPTGIHKMATDGLRECGIAQRCIGMLSRARNHADDGQVELPRKLKVALVVSRHGHDGAGAILHEHVVRDPHRNGFAGGGIGGIRAGKDARLVLGGLACYQILPGRLRHISVDVVALLVAGNG